MPEVPREWTRQSLMWSANAARSLRSASGRKSPRPKCVTGLLLSAWIPFNAGTVYLGTGDGCFDNKCDGVMKTTDCGATWVQDQHRKERRSAGQGRSVGLRHRSRRSRRSCTRPADTEPMGSTSRPTAAWTGPTSRPKAMDRRAGSAAGSNSTPTTTITCSSGGMHPAASTKIRSDASPKRKTEARPGRSTTARPSGSPRSRPTYFTARTGSSTSTGSRSPPTEAQRTRKSHLLAVARQIWRHRLPDARLASVEAGICGVRHHEDLSGALIPERYFAWLRTGRAELFHDVLEHNRQDVVSLALLLRVLAHDVLPERHGPESFGQRRAP